MIKITIKSFRCWDNLTIEIPLNQIVLIKGQSGIGKTTIFQAIVWCLYGNIRSIAPIYTQKINTSVTIEFSCFNNKFLKINRKKNPNRLLILYGYDTYYDQPAQEIIKELFGPYELWLVSCYVGQGCRNNFLSMSNTEKMDLLNFIAFHDEDPKVYIQRIEEFITNTTIEYNTVLKLFTEDVNKYNSLYSDVNVTQALSEQETVKIKQKIETLTLEKKELKELKIQREINTGILQKLQRQLEQMVIKDPEPSNVLSQLLLKYEGKVNIGLQDFSSVISKVIKNISLLKTCNYLSSEIQKNKSIISSYVLEQGVKYTKKDYEEALMKEINFRNGQKAAQELMVEYNKESIQKKIQELQEILLEQKLLKLQKTKCLLSSSLNHLEQEQSKVLKTLEILESKYLNPPDFSKYSTLDLEAKVYKLLQQRGELLDLIKEIKSQKVLKCPKCHTELKYVQGELHLTVPFVNLDSLSSLEQRLQEINKQVDHVNQEIQRLKLQEAIERNTFENEQKKIHELRELKQKVDFTNKILELQEELVKIDTEINKLPKSIKPSVEISDIELQRIHCNINRLQNLYVHDPPAVTSSQIQRYLSYQELLAKQEKLICEYQKNLQNIEKPFQEAKIEELDLYIHELVEYKESLQRVYNIKIQKEELEEQIERIKKEIKEDPLPKIQEISKEIQVLEELLSKSTKAHEAVKLHDKINKEKQDLDRVTNELLNLQKLKQHALESECIVLQQVVDSINETLNTICPLIFNREILVNLELFKTLKSNNVTKPLVNFKVSYHGGVFDNINYLSGGELDRISFVLTLAFNKLSSCPFLMFDESLCSVDINIKELIIKVIKENFNNTVIIIMHDGIEGIFDHVINIDELVST